MIETLQNIALAIMGLAALMAFAGLYLFRDSGRHRRK
jgi:hypothetical protein